MKLVSLFTVLALSFAANVAQAEQSEDLREGEVVGYAQIVDVRDDQMFPIRTITLTAMKPCGARLLGGYSRDLGEDVVEVGVKLAYKPAAVTCLAMPTEREVAVQVFADRPVQILVNGLAIPQ